MTSVNRVNAISSLESAGQASMSNTLVAWKLGLQGVAKMLGMTSQQLHDDLSSGKSLARILSANGKSLADGAQAFLGGVQSGVKDALATGSITQHQADRILQGQVNRVKTNIENQSQPAVASSNLAPTAISSEVGSVVDARV